MLAVSLISGGKAHAATIEVATGSDETTVNANCSLSEAIININNGDATSYPECTGTGVFGTDDTITIPTGTVTLVANLPYITNPLTISGAGVGHSEINGGGVYLGLAANSGLSVHDLTVTAFHRYGIYSTSADTTIERVEVDGTNATFDTGLNSNGFGVIVTNTAANPIEAVINNLHIHNITTTVTDNTFPLMVTTGLDSPGTTGNAHATIRNVTVEDVHGAGNVFALIAAAGMNSFGFGTGILQSEISNVTITNIHSSAGPAAGILAAAITSENRTTTVSVDNSTITDISGQPAPLLGNASAIGLGAFTGGFVDGINNTVNLTVRNMLIANAGLSCVAADASAQFGANASGTFNFTSQGGNLSDDNTCHPYFNQSTDQNNLSSLSSTLGALSNNGGFVPTIPLLKGSPAIDSGVNVSGLATDARLAVRPQGSAYDSGAYESPYTKSVASLASTGSNSELFVAVAVGTILASTLILLGFSVLQTRSFSNNHI